jgi:hypothetical protein
LPTTAFIKISPDLPFAIFRLSGQQTVRCSKAAEGRRTPPTLARWPKPSQSRSVLECASPLALWHQPRHANQRPHPKFHNPSSFAIFCLWLFYSLVPTTLLRALAKVATSVTRLSGRPLSGNKNWQHHGNRLATHLAAQLGSVVKSEIRLECLPAEKGSGLTIDTTRRLK